MDKQKFDAGKAIELRINRLKMLKVYLTEMKKGNSLTVYVTIGAYGYVQRNTAQRPISSEELRNMTSFNDEDLQAVLHGVDEQIKKLQNEFDNL